MMKSSSFQFRSFLIGALGCALLLASMGMIQGQGQGVGQDLGRLVQVSLAPQPADLVTIREGDAYVVPNGKVLVIRTLGVAEGFGADVIVKVDGVSVFSTAGGFGPLELELGVSARAGQAVTLEEPFPNELTTVVALGFLGRE